MTDTVKAPRLPEDLPAEARAALDAARRPKPKTVKSPKLPAKLGVAARVALAAARLKRGIKPKAG